MKATYIDYSETHSFSDTLLNYLAQSAELEPFHCCWPEMQNFGELISRKTNHTNRDVLVNVLQQQYSASEYQSQTAQPVLQNIQRLRDTNTYTITTGHQLNIFTGPLYFIYKIVTAIKLAQELKTAYPENHFVPVYWMATEDHDFEEINHARIHGEKFSWNEPATGATGRINPQSIRSTLNAFKGALGISENSAKLAFLLEEAYLNHSTLADATRFMVHNLFAEYGLVIIDADNIDLKREFSAIIKQDILEQKSFAATTKTSASLEKLGFQTQVHAREINFFYLKEQLRERIVFENDRWEVLNTTITFNRDELTREIEEHPDRFSPNVVMRPLYQEVILPNLAYIGGGAEIVYWLQLKQNFEQFGLSFPILVLRNSALITDKSFSQKLKRLNLSVADVFKPNESLKKEWVLSHSENRLNLTEEWTRINEVFEALKTRASVIDTTLVPSTEAVQARLGKALQNLEQKLIKAEKRNYSEALTQIDRLRNKYFPGDGLQERTENFGLLYTQHGEKLIAGLLEHFKPLDFKFTILESEV